MDNCSADLEIGCPQLPRHNLLDCDSILLKRNLLVIENSQLEFAY